MRIKLIPQRRGDVLEVVKQGKILTVNGQIFDFNPLAEGSTLPRQAINSIWFAGDAEMVDGEVILTLLFPNPWNYSPEQAFPVDLVNLPDGPIIFPAPLPERADFTQELSESDEEAPTDE
jgi:hypothetical protein